MRTHPIRRRAAGLMLATALPLSLAACGDDDAGGTGATEDMTDEMTEDMTEDMTDDMTEG